MKLAEGEPRIILAHEVRHTGFEAAVRGVSQVALKLVPDDHDLGVLTCAGEDFPQRELVEILRFVYNNNAFKI